MIEIRDSGQGLLGRREYHKLGKWGDHSQLRVDDRITIFLACNWWSPMEGHA